MKCPSDKGSQTTRNGFFSIPPDDTCTGSLVLQHSNSVSLGEYRKIFLSEKDQYINIRRKFPVLKENNILGLQAKGDCCWDLFPIPKYRGKKVQSIYPGEIYLPDFQVVSAKGKICGH